jgi:glycogen synthase
MSGIVRAFAIYGRKRHFNRMRESAMAKSFSWMGPARQYRKLYGTIA